MDNILEYTHKGELAIGTNTSEPIQCFVGKDSNGQIRRVISGRSLTKAIGMLGRADGTKRLVSHKTLSSFIDDGLRSAIERPYLVRREGSDAMHRLPHGYEATILHDICQAILDARDAGELVTEAELRYAQFSDALIRGFAKVGIIALVDEATGYQADRDRDELQRILKLYVAEELRPWIKTFPDDYYREMFRLKGWQYSPLHVKRPQVVGRYTNELIYRRLPQGVLDELKNKTPKSEQGNRTQRYHQSLTENIGVPALEKLLAVVTGLMRASTSWKEFLRLMNRAYPIDNQQLELPLIIDNE